MAVEMPPKMVAGKTSRNKRRGTNQSALITICRGVSEGGHISSIIVRKVLLCAAQAHCRRTQ